MRQQLDVKEKKLVAEENMRRQLEAQMNKLTNQRICERMLRGSAENIAANRNSLETPTLSPAEVKRSRQQYFY